MATALPEAFWLGVDQFNQHQFYACHDTLEDLWMDAVAPEKPFYQGILQISVALYHLGNRNWRGTVTLLGEGIQRLNAFQPSYETVDVAALVHHSAALLRHIQEAGPDGIGAIAQQVEQADPNDPNRFTVLTYPAIRQIG